MCLYLGLQLGLRLRLGLGLRLRLGLGLNQKGFSLIELLLTIVISGALSLMTAKVLLNLEFKSKKIIKKVDDSVDLSLLRQSLSKDLARIGKFSVGNLLLTATKPAANKTTPAAGSVTPATGANANFFDYYHNYPKHLLPTNQQVKTLVFNNAAAVDKRIYFLQSLTETNNVTHANETKSVIYNKVFSINASALYTHTGSALFGRNPTSLDESKLKDQLTNLKVSFTGGTTKDIEIKSKIWKNNHLLYFYVPIYFTSATNHLQANKPAKMYSFLGRISGDAISFTGSYSRLLKSFSFSGPSSPVFSSLGNIIKNAPLIGGNKFQMYMTRVEWLTYYFKHGPTTGKNKGGKLYRCIHRKYISNFSTACTASTGQLLLTNIKEIRFTRHADSTKITVSVQTL